MFQDFGKRLFVEAEFLDAVAADFPALVFDESFSFIAEYAGRSILSQYNAAVFKMTFFISPSFKEHGTQAVLNKFFPFVASEACQAPSARLHSFFVHEVLFDVFQHAILSCIPF